MPEDRKCDFILFYGIFIIVIIIDQLTKYGIRANLALGESIVVWEGVLHFTHIQNSGAAFGLFEGYGRLFVPIAMLVVGFSIYMLKKGHVEGKILEVGIALFSGGALGNAIDRVLFNQVTDFIDFQYNNGIPNLADYALSTGAILLVIDMIIDEVKKEKSIDS